MNQHDHARPLLPRPQNTPRIGVSLVIAVFNSEKSLRRLHQEVAEYMAAQAYESEVVYVDDGSNDGSLTILRDIAQSSANVVVVEHTRNRGQAKAVLTGIFAARGDIIVTLDDDLQHQPREIPRLVAALESSSPSTLVMGVADQIKRPLWRGVLGIGANAISNLFLAKKLPLQLTTFCAFRKQLCAYFDPNSEIDLPLITALVQAAGMTRTIPVHINASLRGSSRYGVTSLIRLFLSRSSYYRLSRVLIWAAGAAFVTLASTVLLLAHGADEHPLASTLLPSATAVWLMLVLLAVRVDRQSKQPDLLRANRPA
jgi:glycosyltransferase involved in cell wall biosynthesis